MRFVKHFCFVFLLVCVVLFALLNAHMVRLNLLFTPTGFRLPLSVLLTGVFFAGFLLGCSVRLLRRRRVSSGRSTEKEQSSEQK